MVRQSSPPQSMALLASGISSRREEERCMNVLLSLLLIFSRAIFIIKTIANDRAIRLLVS